MKIAYALTLCSALSLAITAPSNAALTTNLELYYDFESDDQTSGGIHDQSGNNRHGSAIDVSGGSVNYIFDTDTPTLNSITSIRADGTDEILADAYNGILGSASRTIATWVKVDPGAADTANMHIIEWGVNHAGGGSVDGARWTLRRMNQNGNGSQSNVGSIRMEIDGDFLTGEQVAGAPTLNDGGWHHVAAVFDNQGASLLEEVTMYIDGVAFATYLGGGATDAINTEASSVRIGGADVSSVREWNGWIDEVGIWSRPLSSAEIGLLANGAIIIPEPSGVTMLLLGTACMLGARRRTR